MSQEPAGADNQIAIIIPTLNEANTLARCIQSIHIPKRLPTQIIIVDGGSTDDTLAIAKQLAQKTPTKIQVIQSPKGRARQMNAGAELACGQWLWFLHADSDASNIALDKISNSTKPWGYCKLALSSFQFPYPTIAKSIDWRASISGVVTGDQGIFVRKDLFDALGGYAHQALMEDVAISKRLRYISPPYRVNCQLVTSHRRWAKQGWLRTMLNMWRLRAAYSLTGNTGNYPDIR